jgi:hypothetical protein
MYPFIYDLFLCLFLSASRASRVMKAEVECGRPVPKGCRTLDEIVSTTFKRTFLTSDIYIPCYTQLIPDSKVK